MRWRRASPSSDLSEAVSPVHTTLPSSACDCQSTKRVVVLPTATLTRPLLLSTRSLVLLLSSISVCFFFPIRAGISLPPRHHTLLLSLPRTTPPLVV